MAFHLRCFITNEFQECKESVLQEYIPQQLIKNALEKRKTISLHSNDVIQFYMENSNNKLRMYGTADELEENLKVFWQFPMNRRMFPPRCDFKRSPTVYYNLNYDLFYCKQEYLDIYLDSILYEYRSNELSAELKKFLKTYKKRLRGGCFEFFKHDDKAFNRITTIWNFFMRLMRSMNTDELEEKYTLEWYPRREIDMLEVLMSEFPEIFLPNSETKNAKVPVLVRIFEDGDRHFVMETELFNAINLKHPESDPLKPKDNQPGFWRTMDMKKVQSTYMDQITKIDFSETPIKRARHAAVPIPTPSGEFCFLASDGLNQVHMHLICVLNVFQKVKKSNWHVLAEFMDYLEKQFPEDIDTILFINRSSIKKIIEETDKYWEKYDKIQTKSIRDTPPKGFNLNDLNKELKHLGLMELFPDCSESVLEIFNRNTKEVKELKDMFEMVEQFQHERILECFPKQKALFDSLKSGISVKPPPVSDTSEVTEEPPIHEEVLKLKETLKTKDEEVKSIKSDLKDLEETNRNLREDKEKIHSAHAKMIHKKEEEVKKLEEKKKILEEKAKKADDLEKQLKEIQKEVTKKDGDIEKMKKANLKMMKGKDEEMEKLKKHHSQEIKEKKKEIDHLKVNNLDLSVENKNLIQRINQQKDEKDNSIDIEKIEDLKREILHEKSLKDEILKKLTQLTADVSDKIKIINELQSAKTENEPKCLICTKQITETERTAKCQHCQKTFHHECLSGWLQIKDSCPHCRR